MKIALPSFSGLKTLPNDLKEIVKVLEELGRNLVKFTSNGITVSDNLSTEIVQVTNQDSVTAWIEVRHSLRRQPIGFMVRSGGSHWILNSELREKTCRFQLSANTTVVLVLV